MRTRRHRSNDEAGKSDLAIFAAVSALVFVAAAVILPNLLLTSTVHGPGYDAWPRMRMLARAQSEYAERTLEATGTRVYGSLDQLTATEPGGQPAPGDAVLPGGWRDHDRDGRAHWDWYDFEVSLGTQSPDGAVDWSGPPAGGVASIWLGLAWVDLDRELEYIRGTEGEGEEWLHVGSAPVLMVGPSGDVRVKLAPHATRNGRPIWAVDAESLDEIRESARELIASGRKGDEETARGITWWRVEMGGGPTGAHLVLTATGDVLGIDVGKIPKSE